MYEDGQIFAFRDINPQAPFHILVIPRKHVPSTADLLTGDTELMGKLMLVAARLATDLGLNNRGYRFVINCGPEAGQTIPHLHLHLLGGRPMEWPPG
jgi:histidine triad (HIT) family protein